MHKTFLMLVLTMAATAQTTGVITVTTVRTVKAVAGDMVCMFASVNANGFNTECKVKDVVRHTSSATPAVGTAVLGSLHENNDSITWIVTQPVAGTIRWEIAANGERLTGDF